MCPGERGGRVSGDVRRDGQHHLRKRCGTTIAALHSSHATPGRLARCVLCPYPLKLSPQRVHLDVGSSARILASNAAGSSAHRRSLAVDVLDSVPHLLVSDRYLQKT